MSAQMRRYHCHILDISVGLTLQISKFDDNQIESIKLVNTVALKCAAAAFYLANFTNSST